MLNCAGIVTFLVAARFFAPAVVAAATPERILLEQQISPSDTLKDPELDPYFIDGFPGLRERRVTNHLVTDCVHVTSKEGHFVYKSTSDDPTVCGLFFLTDTDRRVELYFTFLDVPCERGGLVAFVDGWELGGEVFPSVADHALSWEERVSEFCGTRVKKVFLSTQNVALIQYRIPARGKGFSVLVRYTKNPTPCNMLVDSYYSGLFTLRNYGRHVNCTLSAMYPAAVRVVALGVGITGINSPRGSVSDVETGTVHKCDKRGLHDQVQIGGTNGLDTTNLELLDSICGVDSTPEKLSRTVVCGVTSVKLMSSGLFDNSVTVSVSPAVGNYIREANLLCGP